MKFILFSLCFALVQFQAFPSHSQSKRISLDLDGVTVESVLIAIEALTEYNFLYNDKDVDYKRLTSIHVIDKPISEILDQLFLNTRITYQLLGRQIILTIATVESQTSVGTKTLQTTLVHGTIEGEDHETLIGATIQIKGTTKGTITDIEGNYTIEAKIGDVLVISYLGYVTQEVEITGQTVVDIILKTDVTNIAEVVVIGYGELRKSDLTGAVTSIRGEDINSVPLADPVQGLQGRIAGMQVLNSSGDPGSAPIIRLRGVTTLNNNNPLFVVDGIIIDVANQNSGSSLDFINPNDITSVEVLKDASATAIFGARGSNGVIIVTTKKGIEGVTNISFSVEQGIESIANKIQLMDSKEFATYLNDITPGTFNNLDALPNVDWQNEIFKDNASIQNYHLSFSGGNKSLNYYSAFGYYSQEGIVSKSNLDRLTGNIKVDFKVKDYIRMGTNIQVAYRNKKSAPNVINAAYWAWPTNPPHDSDGNFLEVQGAGNPLASIEYSNGSVKSLRSLGNLYAEIEPLKGLKLKSSIQLDGNFDKSTNFTPEFFVAPLQQNETSDINKAASNRFKWIWENTLYYDKEWGNHRINSLVGYIAQETNYEEILGKTENLLRENELFWYLNAGETRGEERTVSNIGSHSAITSMLFRVNYVFKDRYLFTATGRRDASSNFGQRNRAGFFPSLAVGWNIDREGFFPAEGVLNQLKLRASWGIVGNEKIGFRNQYSTVASGYGAVFGNKLTSGATFSSPGNPNLKWEQTEQIDVGIQVTAFKGRLKGEFDYFIKNSSDILVDLNAPGYFGLGVNVKYRSNAADVQNRGLEISLSWEDKVGHFGYQIGVNGSIISNKVTGLGEVGADSVLVAGNLGNGQLITRTVVGRPIGFFYGYEIAGVFQNQEQVENTPSLFGQGVGDFIFSDRDGNEIINENDRKFLGSSIPNLIFGFNAELTYKRIGLSFLLQGQRGNYIYNGKSAVRFSQLNYEKRFVNHWSPENPTNSHPRASKGGVNFSPSEYFLEKASFLRLRTLSLSYSLPEKLLKVLNLENVKIFLRATNLFTLTNYSGYSPDMGSSNPLDGVIDNGVYPQTKMYSVGMNFNF